MRLYKHFTHEGGIASPMIAHWPEGIGKRPDWIRQPTHVMDIMPTLLEAAGTTYPKSFKKTERLPMEGRSLLPTMRGGKLPERLIGFDHQGARALRHGDWKLVWGKRMPGERSWELYNLAEDRCETLDVAPSYPDRVSTMTAQWEEWARRVNVIWDNPTGKANKAEPGSPKIANRPLTISGKVSVRGNTGVIAAQGGNQHGWSVHLVEGRLALDVRVRGKVKRITAESKTPVSFAFQATLTADSMTLAMDGRKVAEGASPGLIPVQPVDALSIHRDDRTPAGDYQSPNPLDGKVTDLKVGTDN
ncbi:MAG: hypothetical protein AAF591_20300 [Verrucomicrobiota bacterium]